MSGATDKRRVNVFFFFVFEKDLTIIKESRQQVTFFGQQAQIVTELTFEAVVPPTTLATNKDPPSKTLFSYGCTAAEWRW